MDPYGCNDLERGFGARWSNSGHFVLTLAKAVFEIRTRITPLTLHSGVAAQSWVPLKLNARYALNTVPYRFIAIHTAIFLYCYLY